MGISPVKDLGIWMMDDQLRNLVLQDKEPQDCGLFDAVFEAYVLSWKIRILNISIAPFVLELV